MIKKILYSSTHNSNHQLIQSVGDHQASNYSNVRVTHLVAVVVHDVVATHPVVGNLCQRYVYQFVNRKCYVKTHKVDYFVERTPMFP